MKIPPKCYSIATQGQQSEGSVIVQMFFHRTTQVSQSEESVIEMRFSGQTFSFMTEDSKIGWIKHYDGWNQVLLRFHSIIIITCHFDDVILCILVNFCTSYQVSNLPHFGDTITDPGSTIWNRKSTYRISFSIIWDRQNSHKMFFCCLSFSFFHPTPEMWFRNFNHEWNML